MKVRLPALWDRMSAGECLNENDDKAHALSRQNPSPME